MNTRKPFQEDFDKSVKALSPKTKIRYLLTSLADEEDKPTKLFTIDVIFRLLDDI